MRSFNYFIAITIILLSTLSTSVAYAQVKTLVPYCSNTRYGSEISGSTKPNTTHIAVSQFTQTCIGSLTAALRGVSGNLEFTQLQLEQNVNGNWVVVDQGWNIVYKATPGIYRFTIMRNGNSLKSVNWRLKYSRSY